MSRVARYHADRTNQKLYFVRLEFIQAEKSDSIQQKQAHCEASLFHLHGAILAFFQELVRYYNLIDEQPTLNSIREKLAQKGQVSPEILVLEKHFQYGFLGELKHAYQYSLYAPPPNIPTAEEESSSNLIIKVTQTTQAWLPDTQILREWHQQLTKLIDGFRNEMVEF